MELISDKTNIEQKEDIVLVTRTIVEEYEASDYLDSIGRLNKTISMMTDKQKETKEILDMILDEKVKIRCEEIIEEKKVLQAKEVEEAIEKEEIKKKEAEQKAYVKFKETGIVEEEGLSAKKLNGYMLKK